MARTDAKNIFTSADNTVKDKLAEQYGNLIEGIQKVSVSTGIKNTNYSGDPTSGSVEIDRFKNSELADYGTARTAGAGSALHNTGKVIVNIDTDKEIVEEFEEKDIKLYGVGGLIGSRVNNHINRLSAQLDREFFTVAEAAATAVALTATDVEAELEELIQALEITNNDWVDGVDRDMMVLTLTPEAYGKIRNYIDTLERAGQDAQVEEFNAFHGVEVRSNTRQTSDAILMVKGSVAQPVLINTYSEPERIPLSNASAVALFASYGTKAITADLILKADIA